MKKGCSNVLGHWAIVFACATLLPCMAFAESIEDKLLRFSTIGPDRYADGSVVADGECYALVWSPEGTAFSGFNADGTAISPNDRVVLVGELALNGKCRDTLFQVSAADYAELKGGEWAVCLLDTRRADGVPAGTQDGKPLRVNRWGVVSGGVEIAEAGSARLRLAAVSGGGRVATAPLAYESGGRVATAPVSGVRANILSAVPPNLAPPRITAIEIADGEVRLAVEGTVPYLDYTLISGEKPNDLKTDYFSEVVEGDARSGIAIGTVKSPKRRFFKVKRAE